MHVWLIGKAGRLEYNYVGYTKWFTNNIQLI